MKLCTKCNKNLEYSCFHKDKSKKDGLGSCCKLCTKSRQAQMALSSKTIVLEKACTKCGVIKSSSNFGKDNYTINGLMTKCKLCEKQWRTDNPDKIKNSILKRVYDIDLIEYQAILAEQNFSCILCTIVKPLAEDTKSLAVDHCHKTGAVRGLLCSGHNTSLGKLGDTIENLELVVRYLKGEFRLRKTAA